jgi:hypothetical protein
MVENVHIFLYEILILFIKYNTMISLFETERRKFIYLLHLLPLCVSR